MVQLKPQPTAAAASTSDGLSEPGGISSTSSSSSSSSSADLLLPLDVVDTPAAYVLYADVPGIESAAQLSIQLKQYSDPPPAAGTTEQDLLHQPAASNAAAGLSQQQQQQKQVRRSLTITGSRKVPAGSLTSPDVSAATAASAASATAAAGGGVGPTPPDAVFSQRERNFQPFLRSWVLPDDASSEGITAQVECGVLSIRVAKMTSSDSS
jgi:HSP20 family molecular chaperone IbpA